MKTIKVPQLAWYGPRALELELPVDWNVNTLYMAGYNRPELKPNEIHEALLHPIGSKSLRELAVGKKEVAIVFDDLTRVTRVAKIVPFVLESLADAGIPDDNIRFICAQGLHGAMNRSDFVKKLGEDVISRFRVYNHNPFGNCVYVGTTNTFHTRVEINEEYMKCDLKIAIGSCVPHAVAGFGGGSKIIMPGISSFNTIDQHHKAGGARMDPVDTKSKPTRGMGYHENNLFKKDLDEAAGLAGIDFLINTTVNLWGESVAIFAGHPVPSFEAALKDAERNYVTPKSTGNQIVISNSYAKASESMICLPAAIPLVSTQGGDIVIIANAPEGQVVHYLVGIFGKTTFACQYGLCEIPSYINKIIVFSEYPHRGSSWFEDHEKIIYMSKWEDVIKSLVSRYGNNARVAVIPDATNQYFDWYDPAAS